MGFMMAKVEAKQKQAAAGKSQLPRRGPCAAL